MATETFLIQVKQTGLQEVTYNMDRLKNKTDETAKTLAFFRKALVVFSAVRAVSGLVDFIDTAQRVDNRLRSATTSAEEFARAQEFIRKTSIDTRTDLEANAQVYSRLLRSTQGLDFTTQDLEETMESLSLAIQVGGSTSQEARNSLIQFSQALASGALRGDELRSVSEQLPIIADAIGKEFGVAGGQLIAFAKANPGILETEKAIRGVQKALPGLREQFARISPTIGSAFEVLNTQMTIFISDINKASGFIGILARGIIFLADNLQIVVELSIAFGAVWATAQFARGIAYLIQMSREVFVLVGAIRAALAGQIALNIAVATNPYVLLAGAIAALVAVVILLYAHLEPVRIVLDYLFSVLKVIAVAVYNLAVVFGQALAPVLAIVWNAALQLVPIISALWEGLATLGSVTANVLYPAFIGFYQALIQVFPTLNSLWPLVQVLATAIGVLLYGALATVVAALYVIVNIMGVFGLVTEDTVQKVNDATVNFANLGLVLVGLKDDVIDATKEKEKLNDTLEKIIPNFRKAGDAINRLTGATKKGTEADKEATAAKKELAKWTDMVAGRTQAGWAAYDRLHGSQLGVNKSTVDGIGYINSLSNTLGTYTSASDIATNATDSLADSMANTGNAASQMSSQIASAAQSASGSLSSLSGATRSITDSPFLGDLHTGGQLKVQRGIPATPAMEFQAQQVQQMAQDLFSAGKISANEYNQYIASATDVLNDGYVDSGLALDKFQGGGQISGIYNTLLEKQQKQQLQDAMAAANTSTSGQQNFQTFWPWQDAVGFATGGMFRVPGSVGSTDSVMAALKLSPGEEVEVRAANDRKKRRKSEDDEPVSQPINITFNVQATDVNSFRKNQAQVEADLANAVARANRRSRR